MSTLAPDATPVSSDNGTDNEIEHYWCSECQQRPPQVALCGYDLTGQEECMDDRNCGHLPCIVCEELDELPCEKCGAP